MDRVRRRPTPPGAIVSIARRRGFRGRWIVHSWGGIRRSRRSSIGCAPASSPRAASRPERRPRRSMSKTNYITRDGFNKLRAELDWLWGDERPKVTEAVSVAAALGDRSENVDYIYGKRLREIDADPLPDQADRRATVVDAGPRKEADRVYFGAWVTIEGEDGDRCHRLVGLDEFDATAGLTGRFAGRSVADGAAARGQVVVRRPKGDTVYEILSRLR